jgi:hypothetical protein
MFDHYLMMYAWSCPPEECEDSLPPDLLERPISVGHHTLAGLVLALTGPVAVLASNLLRLREVAVVAHQARARFGHLPAARAEARQSVDDLVLSGHAHASASFDEWIDVRQPW